MKNASPAAVKLGLQIHAITFIPVMIVLAVVNWLTGPPPWALWVFLGWAIGLVAHWLSVRGKIASGAAM